MILENGSSKPVAIVTGASRGIGRNISLALAESESPIEVVLCHLSWNIRIALSLSPVHAKGFLILHGRGIAKSAVRSQ
jgi:hypothetical protein